MSIRHRVRRVRPLPLLLAVALLCAIVGGALGTATVPPTTTSPFAQTPVAYTGAAATVEAQHRATPRFRLGGRIALTPLRPIAIPTRLAASYHGAIPTPRPTIAPRAREPMSPTALKTAVANSAGKGR